MAASSEGRIRRLHRGCLISEKQVGHTKRDLRMPQSFTGMRRMHEVYPLLADNCLPHPSEDVASGGQEDAAF